MIVLIDHYYLKKCIYFMFFLFKILRNTSPKPNYMPSYTVPVISVYCHYSLETLTEALKGSAH